LGLPAREAGVTPAALRRAEGAFLSLSSWGILEISSIDGGALPRSPVTGRLQAAYASASRNAQ